jgi:hypothetical protein
MTVRRYRLAAGLAAFAVLVGIALAVKSPAQTPDKQAAQKPECTQEELQASVPALNDLHEVVYPLWHTAYPNKDYDMIEQLLPQADELTAKLDEAKLPGILRDKQAAWDERKDGLKTALAGLHKAVDADDEEEMLEQTEAFHSAFEMLVRTIRPIAPELEAFHQELYKLYHYYAPQYDLDQIRAAAGAMQEKLPPLKKAELPKRVADRKKDFDVAVVDLEAAVNELAGIARTGEKDKVLGAVEKTHAAYVRAQGVFE